MPLSLGLCRRPWTTSAAGRFGTRPAGSPTTPCSLPAAMATASGVSRPSTSRRVFTLFGYGFGTSAPRNRVPSCLRRAIHHVNLAHGAAVDVIRAQVPDASIGAYTTTSLACRPTPADAAAAAADSALTGTAPSADPQCLGTYPSQLDVAMEPYVHAGDLCPHRRPLDWFGLNHYSPIYAKTVLGRAARLRLSAIRHRSSLTPIQWPIHPEAFMKRFLR